MAPDCYTPRLQLTTLAGDPKIVHNVQLVLPMRTAFTPKQVARALEVGESTVKRWCDKGLIETVRTAGGHRKLPVADVLRFVREQGHALVAPEVLDLPPVSTNSELGLTNSRARLVDALLAGDEALTRQIILNLYLAKHRISVICDEVVAAAFHEIGDRWACRQADVYQERRGCAIAFRLLMELRRTQPRPDIAWPAAGGTIEGDDYVLPSAMAELVLREAGFHASLLGTSIPVASLINAVEQMRPKLFWLSVSHICDPANFLTEFAALYEACATTGSALVVGGRALTEDLRQRMTYSAFCDTMQHLEAFAQTLRRSP